MFKLLYKICFEITETIMYPGNLIALIHQSIAVCVSVLQSKESPKKQRSFIRVNAWMRLIITFVVHWTWTRTRMRTSWAMLWWYWATFGTCTAASLSHWCSFIAYWWACWMEGRKKNKWNKFMILLLLLFLDAKFTYSEIAMHWLDLLTADDHHYVQHFVLKMMKETWENYSFLNKRKKVELFEKISSFGLLTAWSRFGARSRCWPWAAWASWTTRTGSKRQKHNKFSIFPFDKTHYSITSTFLSRICVISRKKTIFSSHHLWIYRF